MIENETIKQLFQYFKQETYELYLVGGCVRDTLLNREINDYDMTTNATPTQMMALADKYNIKIIPTGIKHGTLTFILNHIHVEITTYRYENSYEQHRFPKDVHFTTSLQEDLSRRDFTMNALCMNENGIIDYFHGQEDLKNHCIRCINDPNLRFNEDALRILRALRFHFELDFTIENNTYQAIKNNASLLTHISKERIRDELCKMLLSNHKDILITLKDSKTLEYIIPNISMLYDVTQETPYHIYDVFHHTNEVLNHSEHCTLNMKLALLLHDIEKVNYKSIDDKNICHFKGHAHASAYRSKTILRNLKFDNKSIQEVFNYIYYHDYYLSLSKKSIRKFLYKLKGNYPLAYQILEIQKCDNLGKNPIIIEEKNNLIDQAIILIKESEAKHECFAIKDLNINGFDLLSLNIPQAKIGQVLEYTLKYVVNNQDKNTKEHLLKIAGGYINEIINYE